MNMLAKVAGTLLTAVLAQAASLQAAGLFTEDGYRLSHYRSPTPMEHEQATVLDAQGLFDLLQSEPTLALLDVYRNPWLHGRFTMQAQHHNIPGSLWLANCGDGVLSEDWASYCRRALQQVTDGNLAHPLVFYCRSDCWLGWNAVKRAASWGYVRLYWLRDGIEDWEFFGGSLELAQPVPYAGIEQ